MEEVDKEKREKVDKGKRKGLLFPMPLISLFPFSLVLFSIEVNDEPN